MARATVDARSVRAFYFVAQCSQPAQELLAPELFSAVLAEAVADSLEPEVAAVEELPPRWSVL